MYYNHFFKTQEKPKFPFLKNPTKIAIEKHKNKEND